MTAGEAHCQHVSGDKESVHLIIYLERWLVTVVVHRGKATIIWLERNNVLQYLRFFLKALTLEF